MAGSLVQKEEQKEPGFLGRNGKDYRKTRWWRRTPRSREISWKTKNSALKKPGGRRLCREETVHVKVS